MSSVIAIIPALRTDKFGNCLSKVQNCKSDIKGGKKKGMSSISMEDLWVCVKTYKVGTFDQLSKYVNQPK
jgi:hypothetical protein